jgi:hypothetical protein
MNELFKNFKIGNQDITSKNFTGHASVNFGGEITIMKGGLEQEVSYIANTCAMNIKGYVTLEDWDIQEHLSNVFNGLPIDNLHKFKTTLKESGLTTLADSLNIPANEIAKQIGLQLMKNPLFKKVYGKNAVVYETLSKDEQQIAQLTHYLEGDNFEKLSASAWILKEYVTIDDGVKVKPLRTRVELELHKLKEKLSAKESK